MKELSYSLTLNIAQKNLNKASFFIMDLKQASESFFLSKKILKKTNLIDSTLFIHHPIFLKPFASYKNLINYFCSLDYNLKDTIEFINCHYFQFHSSIQILTLFNEFLILKEIEFFFKNSIFLCKTRLEINSHLIIT